QPTVNGQISKIPLAINTMGSHQRIAMALGVEHVDDLMRQMELIVKAKPPTSLKHAWTLAMQGLDLLNAKPKHVQSGPCQEVIHRFSDSDNRQSPIANRQSPAALLNLPILQCWPQ